MNPLVRCRDAFGDRTLTTFDINGRAAWVAREVGTLIGYEQRGKRFASQITGEWSKELIKGTDYAVLTGRELKAFKDGAFKGTGSVPLGNRGLVLLFEPGIHLALVKTTKPAGQDLRRFLADKVMPQLIRTGRYVPEAQPTTMAERREERLQQQVQLQTRRVSVLERKAKAEALRESVRALYKLGVVDVSTLAAYEVRAAELVTGEDLSQLKPVGPGAWLTPKQIGERLGLTAYTVGRMITELKLRGDIPGLSRSYPHQRPHMDRPVTCHAYSPEAVRRIQAAVLAEAA